MFTQEEKNMAGLISLLGILGLQIVSIILWAIKKDESEFIDTHGKEYINYLISLMIYSFIAGILCFLIIGFIILPVLLILGFIFNIIDAVKAFQGEYYSYPLIIRFIK